MNKAISVFASLLISSLLVSLLVLSACDERSYTVDEVVTAVMERGYDWENMSTGEGSIWGYGPFYIGNFRISLATPDKTNITAGITDTAQELMYIYEYAVGDDGNTIPESVRCIQTIDLKATTQHR